MNVRRPVGRLPLIASVVALASALASCASFELETAASGPPRADCVDDSPACVERRSAALKEMMGDKKRTWVREPTNAHSYAAGVRLFAFKSRKRDLTCEELAHGKREADGAPAALNGPESGGLSPAQKSRGTLLAVEVSQGAWRPRCADAGARSGPELGRTAARCNRLSCNTQACYRLGAVPFPRARGEGDSHRGKRMGLDGYADAILTFVREHKAWAGPTVFVLAFGESLAFISLILPFWAILVGIGTLIGASGGLDFWYILTMAAIGAALGDWLSYWLGQHYHEQIARMWPLRNYPDLLPKGHAFFEKWGAWAVVLGRFSGPLRASVPLVAGIVEMPKVEVPDRELVVGVPMGVRPAGVRRRRRDRASTAVRAWWGG